MHLDGSVVPGGDVSPGDALPILDISNNSISKAAKLEIKEICQEKRITCVW
jgi:hypothetical protein